MPEGPSTKLREFPEEPSNLIYLLKSTNGKVEGSFAYNLRVAKKTLMVVGSGAAPNCVLYEAHPM